jgi:hypothetical protein
MQFRRKEQKQMNAIESGKRSTMILHYSFLFSFAFTHVVVHLLEVVPDSIVPRLRAIVGVHGLIRRHGQFTEKLLRLAELLLLRLLDFLFGFRRDYD